MTTPGVAVTVEIGDWSQLWILGDDPDEATVSEEGCVLDGLTASWQADDVTTQPEAVVSSFSVYVPEDAVGPDLAQGSKVHVLILDPRTAEGDTDADVDPILDFHGRISDADATPFRDGLTFAVNAADPLAELGESKIGNTDWPEEIHADRVNRVAAALAELGYTLEHPWPSGPPYFPSPITDPAGYYTALLAMQPLLWTDGTYQNPYFPDRPAESTDSLTYLKELFDPAPHWVNDGATTHVSDYRYLGFTDLAQAYTRPSATDWRRFYLQPYVAPGVDDDGNTVYRVLWASPRVENTAGLPMRLNLAAGTVSLVTKAEADDATPDTTRDGAWIPGCAIPRDSITWRVDKQLFPNRVRLDGAWQDLSLPDPTKGKLRKSTALSVSDIYASDPEAILANGPVEKQLDLSYLTQPDFDPTVELALNVGDFIAWAKLGFDVDSWPRYTIDSFDILPSEITDPWAWPRLFPDPNRGHYYGGHLGRFLFLYDLATKWNPRGQSRYFGQLIGATLTVEKGTVRMTAAIQQRRPGPNGPPAAPTPNDVNTLIRPTIGADPTPAVKWSDLTGPLATPTWDDLSTDVTALDLWLTTAA